MSLSSSSSTAWMMADGSAASRSLMVAAITTLAPASSTLASASSPYRWDMVAAAASVLAR
jgi:hypothetical protein